MAQYDITGVGTALEFDIAIYNGGRHVWYDSTHVIVAYSGAANDGYIEVFAIDGSGNVTSPGTRFEFDTVQGNFVDIQQVDSTHYIVWWQGVDGDGFTQVMTLNTSTWSFTANGTALEFDTDIYIDGSSKKVDANHFLLTWAGTGTDGFAQIFTVNTSTWAVTVEGTALEFDVTRGDQNSLVQLTSTHFLNCYSGTGADGFAQVLAVNTSTWAVTTVGTPLEFDANVAEYISAVAIDSTKVLVFWRGGATAVGYAQVLSVNNSTWEVTTAGTLLNFETTLTAGKNNSVFNLVDNIYINAWGGTDDDGFVRAFEVNESTWEITPVGTSALEFDTTQGLNSLAFKVSDSRFIIAWQGTDADGFIRAFDVEGVGGGGTEVNVTATTQDISVENPNVTVTALKTVTVTPTTHDISVENPNVTVTALKTVTVTATTHDISVENPDVTIDIESGGTEVNVIATTHDISVENPNVTVTALKTVTVTATVHDISIENPNVTITTGDQPIYVKNAPFYFEVDPGISAIVGKPRIAYWNTNGRPANPVTGECGYNTDDETLEIYNGTEWRVVATTAL